MVALLYNYLLAINAKKASPLRSPLYSILSLGLFRPYSKQ